MFEPHLIYVLFFGAHALFSALYFILGLKVGLRAWLAVNPCSGAMVVYIIGWAVGSPHVAYCMLGFMLAPAVLGVIKFRWRSFYDLPVILAYVAVAVAVVHLLIFTRDWTPWGKLGCIVAGAALYEPFRRLRRSYLRRAKAIGRLFEGTPMQKYYEDAVGRPDGTGKAGEESR